MITLTIIADRGGGMVTGMAEAVRGLVDAVAAKPIADKHRSAAMRALQPVRYGGLALSEDEFVAVVCELAALDASLGWLTAVFNAGAAEADTLGAAHAVWDDDPNMLIANTFHGAGELGRGLRLTGRWESVVGAEYADWLLLPASNGGPCRVLVPRSAVLLDPVDSTAGLSDAGIRDLTISSFAVNERLVVRNHDDRPAVIAGAGVAAAVVGSADGLWRRHVDQARTRLATSFGGEQVSDGLAAQVARAASDIDAAKLQVGLSCAHSSDMATARGGFQQAVARARDAADRVLGSGRHALDASDPVTEHWTDAHAGFRLAHRLLG